jgi:hypothetical protein
LDDVLRGHLGRLWRAHVDVWVEGVPLPTQRGSWRLQGTLQQGCSTVAFAIPATYRLGKTTRIAMDAAVDRNQQSSRALGVTDETRQASTCAGELGDTAV